MGRTHPGIPPDSSLLAMSTSQDQTSNCHFLRPRTPHSTEPEWIPMRMSMSCLVRERTYLKDESRSVSGYRKQKRIQKFTETRKDEANKVSGLVHHGKHYGD